MKLSLEKSKVSWRALPIVLSLFGMVATVGAVAGWHLFRQKSSIFQPLTKFPAIADAEVMEAITASVRLDGKVTADYIRKRLTVAQFQSQGSNYTVFKISTPETCGNLGCLHVVKPAAGMPILLQLQEIDVGVNMFEPSRNSRCFNVIQPQSGADKEFEVCEK